MTRSHSDPLRALAVLVAAGTHAMAGELHFEPLTIDPEPGKVVYAVTVADVDGDGRDDAVAITEDSVLWYEAPDWKKHVILEGVTVSDNVCIVAQDIDGDRKLDFALGAGWPKSGGTIQWLRQGEDIDQPWEVHPIAAIPTTHRMRFANVLGKPDRQPQLVVSPLNAPAGQAGVSLTAFGIPADPVNDRWVPTVLSGNLNRLHNHWCVPGALVGLTGDLAETMVTLTASQEGVHVVYPTAPSEDGPIESTSEVPGFRQELFNRGASGETPAEQGAGEVKTGELAGGDQFVVTIEPMHGTTAAVYVFDRTRSEDPRRVVLTDQLQGGHALWTDDFDKDGDDEVVVGWREPSPHVGISIFDRQADGRWSEQQVDVDAMACEDLIVADLDVNGHLDILAGGRATHNIVLYLNHGRKRQTENDDPTVGAD